MNFVMGKYHVVVPILVVLPNMVYLTAMNTIFGQICGGDANLQQLLRTLVMEDVVSLSVNDGINPFYHLFRIWENDRVHDILLIE
jgi:hypothetical protein